MNLRAIILTIIQHFLFFILSIQLTYSQGQWSWVNGDNTTNKQAVYVVKGPHPNNHPGSRRYGISWTDANGDLWLFGGDGNTSNGDGHLNDLWQYHVAKNQWSWIGGDNAINKPGVYAKKDFDAKNQPGSRAGSVSWTDAGGNLWLFGGFGIASGGDGLLNDLWQFNIVKNQWSWIGGDNTINERGRFVKQGPDPNNQPPARAGALRWIDKSGNLWLLGGFRRNSGQDVLLNDLWQYNIAKNQWSWVGGDSTENSRGVYTKVPGAKNQPAARRDAISWVDASGNLWLFGGVGNTSNKEGLLNDLWQYNIENNQWSWIGGDNTINSPGAYVTRGPHPNNKPGARWDAVSWTDKTGNLWLFGGDGFASNVDGLLNDLWQYDILKNEWSWIGGERTINNAGVYVKEPDPKGQPGARAGGISWTDAAGNLWLSGGVGYASSANASGGLNDLWKFLPCTLPGGSLNLKNKTLCPGDSVNLVVTSPGSTSYQWYRNNDPIAGATTANYLAKEPGTYKVRLYNAGGCTALAGDSTVVKVNPAINATAGELVHPSCTSGTGSATVTATGGTAPYAYSLDAGSFGAVAKFDKLAAGKHMVTVRDNVGCTYSLSFEINKFNSTLSATAVNIVQSACTSNTGSATITATGGIAPYTYSLDGGSFAAANKFDKLAPGKHIVTVRDNGGCTFNLTLPTINAVNPGITYNSVIVTAGTPFPLSARSNVGNTYSWSPTGGLDDPKSPAPTVSTSKDVTYLVTITATTGCITVDTQRVLVAKPGTGNVKDSVVAVPTAFTPNSNGMNDRLKPIPYAIKTLTYFKVFNRWGQLVFETNRVGVGWDGTLNGKAQPTESYTWILECISTSGKTIKQSGRSILIR